MDAPPSPPRASGRITRPAVVWLLVAVLLVAIGWSKTINLLLLLGYLMAALIVVNAWVGWLMVGRVTGRRRESAPLFAGESAAVLVDGANPSDRPAVVQLADPAGEGSAVWFLAPLPAGGTVTLRAARTFAHRGRHPVGPLRVTSGYPLGLVRWDRALEPAAEAVVLPAVGRVDLPELRRWLVRAGGGEGLARRPARRPTLGSGDVRGVRPYRPGDSPRDIHWKTTARRGQLVAREYDQTDPVNLVVVVDPYLPAVDPDGVAAARLEWALSAAVSIGWAWAHGDEPGELTVVVPGSPLWVRRGRATGGLVRDAFQPLADVSGTADVPAVPPGLVRRGSVRTARVVVSPRPGGGPLAAALRAAGAGVAVVDATAPPRWYQPPGERSQGERCEGERPA